VVEPSPGRCKSYVSNHIVTGSHSWFFGHLFRTWFFTGDKYPKKDKAIWPRSGEGGMWALPQASAFLYLLETNLSHKTLGEWVGRWSFSFKRPWKAVGKMQFFHTHLGALNLKQKPSVYTCEKNILNIPCVHWCCGYPSYHFDTCSLKSWSRIVSHPKAIRITLL